jgi:hypothetical protein
MPVRPVIEGADFRSSLKMLKTVDPDIVKDLRRSLRSAVGPDAKAIAAAMPRTAPLSGMANRGRLAWAGKFSGTVVLTPGRGRRGVSNLVGLRIRGNPDAGFRMAELAGSRSRGSTPQGRAMIANLPGNPRGGRFAYARFVKDRANLIKKAEQVIESFVGRLNKRLERR